MMKSCEVVQELMQHIVQSVMDNDVQFKATITKLEGAAGDEDLKAEWGKASKRLDDVVKDLDKAQSMHRAYVADQGSKTDELRAAAARVPELEEQVEFLRRQAEQAERRLALSEQNVRQARETSANGLGSGSAGGGGAADGGGDEFKYQAESRLEEIKSLQKKIIQLTEQNGASSYSPQEVSESMIMQSQAYMALSEQLKSVLVYP